MGHSSSTLRNTEARGTCEDGAARQGLRRRGHVNRDVLVFFIRRNFLGSVFHCAECSAVNAIGARFRIAKFRISSFLIAIPANPGRGTGRGSKLRSDPKEADCGTRRNPN